MINKIIAVAVREYVDAVKTKSFVIGFIITAFIFVALFFVLNKTQKMKPNAPSIVKINVLDKTGRLSEAIQNTLDEYNKKAVTKIDAKIFKNDINNSVSFIDNQKNMVRRGEINAFIITDFNDINESGKSECFIVAKKISDMELFDKYSSLVNDSVRALRFKEKNLSKEEISKLYQRINFEQINLGTKTEKKGFSMAVLMIPFIFLYMMFMGIFGVGQQMLTTVIEEKSSRVYEILLSSLKPFELMAGKIIGLAGVSLTTILFWGMVAVLTALYKDYINYLSFKAMGFFIVYFLLGFLLYSSLIAAIGATCNTTREAQNYMTPITLCAIVPMMVWFYIAQNPDGILSVVLSYIPMMTPMVMVLRLSVTPSISYFQIFTTIMLLMISTPIAMAISAKIFRVGVLMYGKQPSPGEILKWIRYK